MTPRRLYETDKIPITNSAYTVTVMFIGARSTETVCLSATKMFVFGLKTVHSNEKSLIEKM